MIAWRPTSWNAMFCAECRAVVAIASTALGALGKVGRQAQRLHPAHRPADHGVQPLDPQRIEQRDLRADHVADGDDREAHRHTACRPAPRLAGPVEPMQPPMTLAQMTWKRSVSIGLPGPTMRSHQPGLPVIGCGLATCWSPVSAWQHAGSRWTCPPPARRRSRRRSSRRASACPLSSGSGASSTRLGEVEGERAWPWRARIGGQARRLSIARAAALCAPP